MTLRQLRNVIRSVLDSAPRSWRVRPAVLVTCGALLAAASAKAHDFWIIPDAFAVAEGSEVRVRGQTSSRFPTSEAAVAINRVADARLLSANADERVTDMSHAGNSLVLRHRPGTRGQRIMAVTLLPRSVRESVASFRRYLELEGAPEALATLDREGSLRGRDSVTRRYAKYAKTVIEVGRGGPRAFSRAAGHPLEFIPLADPSTLTAGDTLHVRVLYRGRPLAGSNTHAGYVPAETLARPADSSAAASDQHLVADANGLIHVPLRSGGLWNVRMIHIAAADAGSGADWDTHWATLVFYVGQPSSGLISSSNADSAAVATAIDRFHAALASGDSTAAASLLAPDAVIMESGGVETRAEYLSHHLPGDMAFARAIRSVRSPVRVTVHGNAAWATSTSTAEGVYRERPVNSAGAELMVLTRTPAGWRITAIHWSSRARRPAAPR